MSYQIAIVKKAFKELTALPQKINVQVVKAIDSLKEEPRPAGCKKLKGESENIWRIRVGDYRILYFLLSEVSDFGYCKPVVSDYSIDNQLVVCSYNN